METRKLLNGDEAVALAALDGGIVLGTGYPGTPSTEILEAFDAYGGRAQWAPNEKVALEVGLGAAFARARVLVTMKHVGLNVASDPLFTVAYTGVDGALVIAVADDPGMASSQNEQDSRRYAVAAGVPMLEPADSQQAYDFTRKAIEISERWNIPVLLRLTTRVSHSKTIVERSKPQAAPKSEFVRDIPKRVMVPGYARPAHKRLRAKLNEIKEWANQPDNGTILYKATPGKNSGRGIIASGVAVMHAREAAPESDVLQVVMSHPFPDRAARAFDSVHRETYIVEEGDPVLRENAIIAGIAPVETPELYRFGELSTTRVARMLECDDSPEAPPPPGKPPQLCPGCPHSIAFEVLRDQNAIVSGDIGCYTLGVMPPFQTIDLTVCMGASISAGLGLRHVLPAEQARRVVSVIGDSTFMHSGLTGIAEMVYNPPATGHVVVILDNGTTAMTGLQEHPGTGRSLDRTTAHQVVMEDVVRALGVPNVEVIDSKITPALVAEKLAAAQASGELWVIIIRRPCILAAPKIRQYEAANATCGCASKESE